MQVAMPASRYQEIEKTFRSNLKSLSPVDSVAYLTSARSRSWCGATQLCSLRSTGRPVDVAARKNKPCANLSRDPSPPKTYQQGHSSSLYWSARILSWHTVRLLYRTEQILKRYFIDVTHWLDGIQKLLVLLQSSQAELKAWWLRPSFSTVSGFMECILLGRTGVIETITIWAFFLVLALDITDKESFAAVNTPLEMSVGWIMGTYTWRNTSCTIVSSWRRFNCPGQSVSFSIHLNLWRFGSSVPPYFRTPNTTEIYDGIIQNLRGNMSSQSLHLMTSSPSFSFFTFWE